MAFFDRRTFSVLLTILLFACVLAVIWLARLPIVAFIFAIFFAHLLEPVVVSFENWLQLSRGKAIAVTYAAIFLGLVIFGFTVGPRILHQGERLPEILEKVKSGTIAWQVGNQQGWSRGTEARIQNWLVSHQGDIERYGREVAIRLEQLVSNLAWILLVPVLAVFFLKDRSELSASVVDLISTSQHRKFLDRLLSDLDTMLGQFVRAQLLLGFFALIAYGVFLLIARVPYAFAVAAIAGALELIPFAGPLLGLGILLGVAFLTGYSHWIVLVAFWVVWRIIQDYVNTPRVMGEGLDLHPLLSIFAILVGGEVGGIIGIYLSIPAVAALRIIWINWTQRGLTRKAA